LGNQGKKYRYYHGVQKGEKKVSDVKKGRTQLLEPKKTPRNEKRVKKMKKRKEGQSRTRIKRKRAAEWMSAFAEGNRRTERKGPDKSTPRGG